MSGLTISGNDDDRPYCRRVGAQDNTSRHMVPECIRKSLATSVVFVILASALCSCIGSDSSSQKVTNPALDAAQVLQATSESEGGLTHDATMSGLHPSVETGNEIQSPGGSTSTDTMLTREQTPQANELSGQLTSVSGSEMSDGEMHETAYAYGSGCGSLPPHVAASGQLRRVLVNILVKPEASA